MIPRIHKMREDCGSGEKALREIHKQISPATCLIGDILSTYDTDMFPGPR